MRRAARSTVTRGGRGRRGRSLAGWRLGGRRRGAEGEGQQWKEGGTCSAGRLHSEGSSYRLAGRMVELSAGRNSAQAFGSTVHIALEIRQAPSIFTKSKTSIPQWLVLPSIQNS